MKHIRLATVIGAAAITAAGLWGRSRYHRLRVHRDGTSRHFSAFSGFRVRRLRCTPTTCR